jgi:hypothetical protein
VKVVGKSKRDEQSAEAVQLSERRFISSHSLFRRVDEHEPVCTFVE